MIVDANVLVNGVKQSEFGGGTITISVPYSPKPGEDVSKLAVYYLADDGSLTRMNGYYDAESKTYIFTTTHLSTYVLMEDNVPFTDVPDDAYYRDAVRWAVKNDITQGESNTAFAPNGACTRAQAVTFLWRTAGKPVVNFAMRFSDVNTEAYCGEAVRWAVSEKITSGTSTTTFAPADDCARAQIVSFLYRFMCS